MICDIKMSFRYSSRFLGLLLFICTLQHPVVQGFPEQGKWTLRLNESQGFNGVAKNLYQGTKIFIRVNCHYPNMKEAGEHGVQNKVDKIKIGWILRETQVQGVFLLKDFGAFPLAYPPP